MAKKSRKNSNHHQSDNIDHGLEAEEFSASEFRFYIDEPTIIDYPEMSFSIKNASENNSTIKCEGKEIDAEQSGEREGLRLLLHNICFGAHQ